MTEENWIALRCHPSTRTGTVQAIWVRARRSASAEIRISFRVDGDISCIRIPAPALPRINTRLWQHTVCEAFIAMDGQPSYHELNFAPSGEWAVYHFASYRNGGPLADETVRPQIAVRSDNIRFELDAVASLPRLSAAYARAPLRIGLAAVIEAGDGISYWALRHPASKPDFHLAGGFALLLEPPGPVDSPC